MHYKHYDTTVRLTDATAGYYWVDTFALTTLETDKLLYMDWDPYFTKVNAPSGVQLGFKFNSVKKGTAYASSSVSGTPYHFTGGLNLLEDAKAGTNELRVYADYFTLNQGKDLWDINKVNAYDTWVTYAFSKNAWAKDMSINSSDLQEWKDGWGSCYISAKVDSVNTPGTINLYNTMKNVYSRDIVSGDAGDIEKWYISSSELDSGTNRFNFRGDNSDNTKVTLSNIKFNIEYYDGDPTLEVTKALSSTTTLVNQPVTVTLSFKNIGSNVANEPWYNESPLPAGLTLYSGSLSGDPGDLDPGETGTKDYQITASTVGVVTLPGTLVTYTNPSETKNFETSFNSVSLTVYGGTATPNISFSSVTLRAGATETISVTVLDSITGFNVPDATVIGTVVDPSSKTYQFYLNYDAVSGKYVNDFNDTLSTGTYTLQVSAESSFYTTGVTVPSSFTVVSRPATQVALAGTMGDRGWYKSDVNVAFSVAGGSPHLQTYYKFDEGAQQLFSAPFLITSEGGHTLEYWTVDVDFGDNDEIQHNTQYVYIDKSVPTSTCSALSPYSRLTFTVQWSGEDASGSQLESYDVQYRIGGGGWNDWLTRVNQTFQVFDQVQGENIYYFRVRARDTAGNVEDYPNTPDTWTIVDISSPSAPAITSTHQEGVWNTISDAPQFNLNATDAISPIAGYNISLLRSSSPPDSLSLNFTGTATTYMSVGDGIWYFHARARDSAGNWGPAKTYGPVKIDLLTPTFSYIGSSRDPAKAGSAIIVVTASEQMSVINTAITQNGAGAVPITLVSTDSITWTGTYNVQEYYDGTASISVSGFDLSGKSGSGSSTFLVDTVRPSKPALGSPTHQENTPTSQNTPRFAWSAANDAGGTGVAGYSYTVNQAYLFDLDISTETMSTSYTSPLLADGTYWFHLGAVDLAGNISETARYKFVIDTTSPTYTALANPNLSKVGGVTITINSNELLSEPPTVTVRQNGQGTATPVVIHAAAATVWQGTYVVVEGFDGTATISVSGKDLASNATSYTSTFQVDTIGPSASVGFSPSSTLKAGAFALTITIQDANTVLQTPTVYFTLSDGTTMPVTLTGADKDWHGSGFIYSSISTGTAIVHFSASDAVGNIGTAITSGGTFIIDTSISGITGGTIMDTDGTTVVTSAGAYNGFLNIIIETPDPLLGKIISANHNTQEIIPITTANLYRDFRAKDSNTQIPVTGFLSPLTIKIHYPDIDSNGIIDGTNINENRLSLFWLNEAALKWEEVLSATLDNNQNVISADVYHFSIYALLANAIPNLKLVRAYPVPWTPGSGDKYDTPFGGCGHGLQIDNLTSAAKISIYSLQGDLVRLLNVVPADTGCKSWDGKNETGRKVTSGVYMAVIESSSGQKAVKKLVIER